MYRITLKQVCDTKTKRFKSHLQSISQKTNLTTEILLARAKALRDPLSGLVRCEYCGAPSRDWTLDHKHPKSLVKTYPYKNVHDRRNLAICCYSCNSIKGTKTAEEYLAFLTKENELLIKANEDYENDIPMPVYTCIGYGLSI